jgi:hypothetical protein
LSLTGNNGLLAAAGANQSAYSIDQSLRFNNDAYLSRTPGSAGNRRTWTLSFWVKRGMIANSANHILDVFTDSSNRFYISIPQTDKLDVYASVSNSAVLYGETTAVFRDPASWAHYVCVYDSTDSTAADRFKVFANGVRQDFTYTNTPSLNQELSCNSTTPQYIGAYQNGASNFYEGYLAEFHFIDGTALTAASFGETNSDTNQWQAIKYAGSYGTNGFYLKFQNSSALGDDSSGNTNDFTVNALVATDQVKDSPSNNFATLNPLVPPAVSGSIFSEGNLKYRTYKTGGDNVQGEGTIGFTSGKWYWEIYLVGFEGSTARRGGIGVGDAISNETWTTACTEAGIVTLGNLNGQTHNTTYSGVGDSWTTAAAGQIWSVAFDADAGTMIITRDAAITGSESTGKWTGFATSTVGYRPITVEQSASDYTEFVYNFGQDSSFAGAKTAQGNSDGNSKGDFYYTPPSGYLALCTDNLSDPGIALPTAHFNTVLYTGDASNPKTVSGVGFSADMVWLKSRGISQRHNIYDTVRGIPKSGSTDVPRISPDDTTAESDTTDELRTVTSDGFTVDTSRNGSGNTYVAWNWKGSDTPTKTFVVTVTDPGSGNRYTLDGKVSGTNAMPITIEEGGTYTFDQSDNTNSGHPLRFSTTSNGTWGGGSEYTTGVTTNGTPGNAGAYTRITVAASAPTLYYYCTNHSGMGAAITTPGSGGGVSDLSGTIASVVNANTTAGMSVVTWTNHNVTVGHGLSQAPELIIIKDRSAVTSWLVYSKPVGNGHTLFLNTTGAQDNGTTYFNSTSPTSSVFSVGTGIGGSTDNYIAYCFHSVDGYSSIAQYPGNGAQDGTFVYTGFRPAFIFIKRITNAGSNSYIVDNKRVGYNNFVYATDVGSNKYVWPDSNAAEGNGDTTKGIGMDILSNGFKFRTTGGDYNASSNYYLYYAIAESPFKTANAR